MAGILHTINSNDLPDCQNGAKSVVFVDDDTDSVHANRPEEVVENLQKEVNNSVNWLKDKRLCAARDKSKLLVVGTGQLKSSRVTRTSWD